MSILMGRLKRRKAAGIDGLVSEHKLSSNCHGFNVGTAAYLHRARKSVDNNNNNNNNNMLAYKAPV